MTQKVPKVLRSSVRAIMNASRELDGSNQILLDAVAKLFHADWYRALYPDIAASGTDPLNHYLKRGYIENRSPHPMFDAMAYLELYDDVRQSGMPAIIHYMRSGGKERRSPNRWVDLDLYLSRHGHAVDACPHMTILEDFAASEDRLNCFQFLDQSYYASTAALPEGATPNDVLLHFFVTGLLAGHEPNRLIKFDRIGVEGSLEERLARFNQLFMAPSDLSNVSPDGIFDTDFFVRKHGQKATHPTIHYLRHWRSEHLWPHPLFDAAYYSRVNHLAPDEEPFGHYVNVGRDAGAWPNAYFDTNSYRQQFGHLFAEGQDEIQHYLESGHLEWFEPSERFGQRYYLSKYPDVAERQERPLLDYLHGGKQRGRTPLPPKPFFDPTAGRTPVETVELIRETVSKQKQAPLVSVIVPAYENIEYTLRCVLSMLISADSTPLEIIIADDQSPDGSGQFLVDELQGVGPIRVHINETNLGFLKSCNAAAKMAKGKYLFFLNNDTAVVDGWIDELIATFERNPDAGLVGSKLVYPNGLLQEAGGIIWEDGSGANFGRMKDPMDPAYNYQRDADYISGAAILIPRDFWEEQGGFSEELSPAYYEDTDFAMKTRAAGRRVIYQPLSTVVHYEGISSGTDITAGVKKYQAINRETFLEKWGETLKTFGKPGDFSRKIVDREPRARILIFDAEVPKPDKDSGSITAFNYVKILSELGYAVTFVPECLLWEGRYSRDLQRLGAEVIYSPQVTRAREWVLNNGEDFDLFILSRVTTGGEFFNDVKDVYPEKPIIFDTVDIHHLRLQREAELNGSPETKEDADRLKRLELATISNADATIVVSDYEVEYLRNEIGPFPSVVIPLIYEPYTRINGFDERTDIAFIGGYRHPPNIDAVRHLVDDIWPIVREMGIDARLHIIGSHMPASFQDYAASDINIVGFVPDLDRYLETIRITVAPLRYGAGVKGKVGNSLRLGVPVVCTPVAAEGMGMEIGKHILAAPDPYGFAKQIERLYSDKALWDQQSKSGQQRVMTLYGVEPARTKLAGMVSALIGRE